MVALERGVERCARPLAHLFAVPVGVRLNEREWTKALTLCVNVCNLGMRI